MMKNLKIKWLPIALILSLILLPFGSASAAEVNSGDIVVLYTNDIHCAVDENIGYAGLAAYVAETEAVCGEANVTLVDAGDAVQGAALGTLSKGAYPIEIMNEVGYDVVTPGNHEFDYGMARMLELMGMHKAAVVSCNFQSLQTGKTVFAPYAIIDYGAVQIAYVGISTPKTFTSSTPKYFQNDTGKFIYSFCEDNTGEALYDAVQDAVDDASSAGADYVIAVGHCGVGEDVSPWQSTDIIANTTGIDVFIDGHSHSTIPSEPHDNAAGDEVLLTSTGTKLAAIGKLVVKTDGTITTELVTEYTEKAADIETFVGTIKAENDALLNTVVAKSDIVLTVKDPATGNRLVRSGETNLGDLCADAYRTLLGSDIAVVNGGGIRANVSEGDVTYNNIISVHPFGNMACVVEASGQEILDLLEMGARNTPGESGGFQQVSGLSYEVHTYVRSSVVLDDKGNFVSTGGEYRVKNVTVGGIPLDLNKTYTVASHNYLIKDGGDGFPLFMNNKLLQDEVMIDNQVLITYIVDRLNGVVGAEYADPYGQGRIAVRATPFTDVSPRAWYASPIAFAYGKGITNGVSAARFAPNAILRRAMFLTMLYRQEGSPAVDGSASAFFADCADNAWYADAVVWAAENGILDSGAGALLQPEAGLTRQEMAVYLYRYIKSEGGGFTGAWMFLMEYSDLAEIDDSAYEAVAFCSMHQLLDGTRGAFLPDAAATRAMAATALQRYDTFVSAKSE